MQYHDLQGVEINAPYDLAFEYLTDPVRLPEWTNAFVEISPGKAVMRTPAGEMEIGLEIVASKQHGTIDSIMTFPDNSVAKAHSRLVQLKEGCCSFSFVLPAPTVALEQLEGALAEQSKILREELEVLKAKLEQYDA